MAGIDPPLCVVHVGRARKHSTLTPEIAERLVSLLRAGNYIETSLAAAGLARRTFYEWLERGDPETSKAADGLYRDFRERVDQARAEGEARNVALVAKAATSDWKAAAWMLERQFPDRWGRPGITQRTGGGGAPIVGDGHPHDDTTEAVGATVTPLDALRRRAAAGR